VEKPFPTDHPVHELLRRRWSPRAFDPHRRVPPEAIASLLEAARIAPSCFNEQPWRFLVFDGEDAEALERARDCLVPGNAAWARRAPMLILSVAQERWSRDGTPDRWGQHDVGLSTASLLLQATALGLAAHAMGGFDADRARRSFGIPDGFTPMAMIAVGYFGDVETLEPKQKAQELAPRQRKSMDGIVFHGAWDRPYRLEAREEPTSR